MKKLSIAALLLISVGAYADEENGKRGLGVCMTLGAVAGDVQAARQETGWDEYQMINHLMQDETSGDMLPQVVAVVHTVYSGYPNANMPSTSVSEDITRRCLLEAKIEKMEPAAEVPKQEFYL